MYFPLTQSMHDEALSTLDDFPGAHSVHVEAISKEYLPLAQVAQEVEPEVELYLPAIQLRQSERRSAPGVERYLPASQLSQ